MRGSPSFSSVEYSLAGKEYAFTFYCLLAFTFILYVAPQSYFTFLAPLRLARLISILAVASYVLQRGLRFDLNYETTTFLLIIFFAFLSIPFSIWPGGSFDIFTDVIKVVITFLIISNALASLSRLKQMLWFLVGCCTFLALFTINQYLGKGFLTGTTRIIGAASGMAANPNDIALTMVLIVPIALSLFMTTRHWIGKTLSSAYIVLSTAAIFVTFSRSGFLALLTVYGVFFYKELKRNVLKTVLIIGIMFVVFVSLFPAGYTTRLSSILNPQFDTLGTIQSRKDAMRASIPVILHNPVFGVGLGMSGIVMHERGLRWTLIHNAYLQLGAEVGIPALVAFLLLLYRLIRNMRLIQILPPIESVPRDFGTLARGFESSLLGFVVAAFFFPVPLHFYLYYIAGFSLALKKIHRSLVPEQPRLAVPE